MIFLMILYFLGIILLVVDFGVDILFIIVLVFFFFICRIKYWDICNFLVCIYKRVDDNRFFILVLFIMIM